MYRPIPKDLEHRQPITDPSWRSIILAGVTIVVLPFVMTVLLTFPGLSLGIGVGAVLQYVAQKAIRITRLPTTHDHTGGSHVGVERR